MSRFAACVKKVAKRRGVKSPRAVCAAIGRRKYGQAGMTALAAAGRRKNAAFTIGAAKAKLRAAAPLIAKQYSSLWPDFVRDVLTKMERAHRDRFSDQNFDALYDYGLSQVQRHGLPAKENPWKGPTLDANQLGMRRGFSGLFDTAEQARKHKAQEYPHNSQMVVTRLTAGPGGGLVGYRVVDKRPSLFLANAGAPKDRRAWINAVLANDETSTDAELVKYFTDNGLTEKQAKAAVRRRGAMLKRLLNPAAAAKEAYELTHGRPSTSALVVTKKVHHHEHLADWGELVELVVKAAANGATVKLSDFGGARLAMNEKRTQLFVVGGDQAIDLDKFGLEPGSKELYVLGELKKCAYYTAKDHLGADGGEATYVHEHGELWRERPTVLYDEPNTQILLAGGVYTMPAEGITD